MICWLSKGEGPLGVEGGGGQHYKSSVFFVVFFLFGWGVDCEIKIWQGGGLRRNDGFTK